MDFCRKYKLNHRWKTPALRRDAWSYMESKQEAAGVLGWDLGKRCAWAWRSGCGWDAEGAETSPGVRGTPGSQSSSEPAGNWFRNVHPLSLSALQDPTAASTDESNQRQMAGGSPMMLGGVGLWAQSRAEEGHGHKYFLPDRKNSPHLDPTLKMPRWFCFLPGYWGYYCKPRRGGKKQKEEKGRETQKRQKGKGKERNKGKK